ncbi:MAG: helix-turn-helix domain-containing protein [Bordetella sp.]|uniref:helix-turn-helix domain-containing protein n=1 Tax=Bordetella sp. TaxID=28081 RepID=UPI003F7CA1B8
MNGTRIEIRHYSGEIEQHSHDYHQVVMPCQGALEIEVGSQAGRVGGSIGAFVPAGSRHAFHAVQANAFVVLDVPTGLRAQSLDQADLPSFFIVDPGVHGLLEYMNALGSRALRAPAYQQAWSTLLLGSLAAGARHGTGRLTDDAESVVLRATSFMQRRLADPIRVADIARAAGVNPRRLHEAFLERRDTTPHARLAALRLDAAERLLADPTLSIVDIALQSGHADQSALTRAMRRERDMTPARVRRCLLGKSQEKA